MALDVDGFAVFRAIAASPQLFGPVDAEVRKAARALLVKFMKAKSLSLSTLRDLQAAVGPSTCALLFDGMSAADLRGVLSKVDKHFPDLKTGADATLRKRAVGLANGTVEPSPKSSKSASPSRRAAPKGPKVASVNSPAFMAEWDGSLHEAPEKKGRTPKR